jgi:4-hydroxy-tetrahydrodipicolinate reductase
MTTRVLLAGVPGKMCAEIARLCAAPEWSRFEIARVALGSNRAAGECPFEGRRFTVLGTPARAAATFDADTIAIDFSTPDAALANVAFYCERGIPFVLGTTGFDVAAARDLVAQSQISAVIAPNMAAPIVAVLSTLRRLSDEHAGALAGMQLTIRESHQSTKRDVSGTARALHASLAKLGMEMPDPIESVRDPAAQLALGVQAQHLAGHGWHWLNAKSACGQLEMSLTTRVNGRRVYAEGALRAAEFLAARMAEGVRGVVYSMEDVLAARG